MNLTATQRDLNEKHREEMRASGLNDATIEAAGFFSVENGEICQLLGWTPREFIWNGAYAIPYPHADGYCRVKPDWPRTGENGKPRKYEAPIKKPNRAYFGIQKVPPVGTVIVITEGEKKALAIQQSGIACIGLSGVWNWQAKRLRNDAGRAYGKRELIPDLAAIDWNREVIVCFDSDAASNSSVRLAECRLAETLTALGASVRIARIPSDGDAKVGADDFIVAHGVDAFRTLLDEAKEAEQPPALESMDLARLYVEEFWTEPEGVTLRTHLDEYYAYTGTHYAVTPKRELQSLVLEWQNNLMRGVKPRHAAETVEAIYAVCRVPFNVEMPTCIGTSGYSHPNWLAFANGILDLDEALADEKSELRTNSPKWFSTFALPYDFDAAAECPTWYTTLHEIFDNGNDQHVIECVNALGEFFGYTLTNDTTQHRIGFFEGPRRTGKSTVLKVLEAVIGKNNVATPTLTSLGDQFGLWPLLGKRLAIFADAHLGRGDKAMGTLERLKAISGEDAVDVHRKFLPSLTGIRLPIRFALACNELPRFGDNANALASRLLILPFRNSFLGKEDRRREAKLKAELPGVFNWALEGLKRLRKQGRFTVPKASEDALAEFERHTSPVKAFVEEQCVVDAKSSVNRDDLWKAWTIWADACGQKRGNKSLLGVRLRSLLPGLGRSQPREGDQRLDLYSGLKLK